MDKVQVSGLEYNNSILTKERPLSLQPKGNQENDLRLLHAFEIKIKCWKTIELYFDVKRYERKRSIQKQFLSLAEIIPTLHLQLLFN